MKRFHQYLYGQKFILYTDHKPLLTLFSPSRGIPSQVLARIQRWALTMAVYEYDIKYKKTSQHGNAEKSEVPTEVVLLVEALEDAPMTYAQIQRWIKRDPLLSSHVVSVHTTWLAGGKERGGRRAEAILDKTFGVVIA